MTLADRSSEIAAQQGMCQSLQFRVKIRAPLAEILTRAVNG